MPIHDWSRVEAGIFHDFHHALIEQIKRDLNGGLLPSDYYAMAEQVAARLGPDALALHAPHLGGDEQTDRADGRSPKENGGIILARPKVQPIAQTEMESYRRKKSWIAVRHVSGDRVVAIVEVVSPGHKSTAQALEKFVQKVAELLERGIHFLIIDLIPPGRYDPRGIHGAVWDYIDGRTYSPPPDKPLTLAAYESGLVTQAYVVPIAVGDVLPEMPLFLEPDGCVEVPLEDSYQSAWEAVPRRWKSVLESPR
jgi:Protein of unknown function (DUF4058)